MKKPIAEVVPPAESPKPANWLGCMAGTGKITGDIVAPASDESDWDIFSELKDALP